jgi:paraquat-inducible protein B
LFLFVLISWNIRRGNRGCKIFYRGNTVGQIHEFDLQIHGENEIDVRFFTRGTHTFFLYRKSRGKSFYDNNKGIII